MGNGSTDDTPLRALLLANGGWMILEDVVERYDYDVTAAEDLREMIRDSPSVQVVDMGEDTLLVHPQCDVRDAVAEWSDREERAWRRLLGWAMPEREDFRP